MKKVERITILCKRCGSPKKILPKLLEKGRGKYCSVSCARKDHPPIWMHQDYGSERRANMSKALKGKYTEEKASAWKGDGAGYRALHLWVERHLGKAFACDDNKDHISTRYHWANISGHYKRELDDWKQLCPKCHYLFDKQNKEVSN